MPKRVLVTGSSRGIGRQIAIRLAADGWQPLIHYKSQIEEATKVAELSGGIFCPRGFDLSKPEECDAVWDWASSIGEVSALVNNAGVYALSNFDHGFDSLLADWDETYRTNFLSTLRLTKRFVDSRETGGKILNVCSRVGFKGEAGAAAYAASKAAQISLVRSLSVELAPRQIGVFGIAPGWAEPALRREGMEAKRKEVEASIPLGRVATPEDCAAAVAFLMSDEAAYLSGVIIDVNGASYFH